MRVVLGCLLGLGCNAPPGAAQVAIVPAEPVAGDALRVALASGSEDPDADDVTYTVTWSVDGTPADDVDEVVSGDRVVKGQVWQATVVPSDGRTDGPAATASVEVGNTAPEVTSVRLEPAAPVPDDEVTCVAEASDVDADPVELRVKWYVDGELAGADAVLPASAAGTGSRLWCEIVPTDGEDDGRLAQSPVAAIDGSPPEATVPVIQPDPARAGDVLTASSTGSDPDGDPVELRYAWTVDGAPIGGSDTLAVPLVAGQRVEVTVTPSDGTLQGTPQTAALIVSNTEPAVTAVELFPPDPATDDVVVALVTAFDPDGPVALSYEWRVDGSVVAQGADPTLDGALAFDKGQLVEVTVTADDGAASASGAASVIAVNTPPSLSGATVTPSVPRTDDALTCVPGGATDPDQDALSYTFGWTVDGVPQVADTDTLDGAAFAAGQAVGCFVTPSDGEAPGATVASSVVVVVNSAPVVATVEVVPADPDTDSVLTCTPGGAQDPDGDAILYTWAWTVDGLPVPDAGSTLDGALAFDKGQSVACAATPTDGRDAGVAVSSAPVVVGDAAPSAPRVALAPTPSPFDQDLTCFVVDDAVDPDGDVLVYTVRWTMDGAPWAGTTQSGALPGDTIAAADLAIGASWDCAITASDGDRSGPDGTAGAVICDPGADDATACAAPPPPPPTGITLDPELVATARVVGSQVTGWFGARNAVIDYNGDGLQDLVVASPFADENGLQDNGALYVFYGPLAGDVPDTSADVVLYGAAHSARFGSSIAVLPDLDGDGDGELLVDRGLYLGGTPGGDALAQREYETFCRQGLGLGDTDGDGDSNWVCVHGSWAELRDGIVDVVDGLYDTVGHDAWYNPSLGDVDDDGIDELVMATAFDGINAFSRGGLIYVFEPPFTETLGILPTDAAIRGQATWISLGAGMTVADIDGDGVDDILAAAPYFEQQLRDEGAMFGFLGPVQGPLSHSDADVRIVGRQTELFLGPSPLVRDFDGDGVNDLVINAVLDLPNAENAGAVWMLRGPTRADRELADALVDGVFVPGAAASDRLGYSAAWADDLDGDGQLDLVVGAPGKEVGGVVSGGAVYVIPGPF